MRLRGLAPKNIDAPWAGPGYRPLGDLPSRCRFWDSPPPLLGTGGTAAAPSRPGLRLQVGMLLVAKGQCATASSSEGR
jgi:hypothetical protein